MADILHFRTKKSGQKPGVGSLKMMKSRGTDYSTIRPALPTDDARDIAWKQYARSDSLSVKSREDSLDLDIELIGIGDTSWGFFLENMPKKGGFYDILSTSVLRTARQYGYSYDELFLPESTLADGKEVLMKKRKKNALVLLVVSSLDIDAYRNLGFSRQNDVIIIHLLHPYELDPSIKNNLLIESRSVDISRYKKELAYTLSSIKKILGRQGIDFLSVNSLDNPVDALNNFFKYRYARK